jgi:elongation factor G
MDFMELERERGITISSAATNVSWKDHDINIIDTPGHVDFTIEVENSLRVLDGAILVLCSVGGVQSQSITVDRQMKRYGVPCIAFINKMDRVGGNPYKVVDQLIEKLGHNAVLMQIPIGLEDKFEAIIDLVEMNARFFEGANGTELRIGEIPDYMMAEALKFREALIDKASVYCDELMNAALEDRVTNDLLRSAVRNGVLARKMTPVFIGSAVKNKGVQALLDAIVNYLPSPNDRDNFAYNLDDHESEVKLQIDDNLDTVAMAFKLDNQAYGQLTYIRIYQGKIRKGMDLYNVSSKKRFKVGRLIRMHAENMEDIESAGAGDIIALYGVSCSLGDTFVSGDINYSLKSMYIPAPIISMAIKGKDKKSEDAMAKALNRFQKEDPTFKSLVDEESLETIIWGMGELHLEVYIERMRREYKANLEVGQPQVSYRETITQLVKFDYTHKKQSGGRGQYARVCGIIEPSGQDENILVDEIKGGVIPSVYIPSVEKGFNVATEKGTLVGFPIVGVSITLNDGNYHPVDSSALAFELAMLYAIRENYFKAKPVLLEPIMKLEIDMPSEYRSAILGSINQKRGIVLETTIEDMFTKVVASIPLSEIFGYATTLRSLSQGKAEFNLEFYRYEPVPKNIEEKIVNAKKRDE